MCVCVSDWLGQLPVFWKSVQYWGRLMQPADEKWATNGFLGANAHRQSSSTKRLVARSSNCRSSLSVYSGSNKYWWPSNHPNCLSGKYLAMTLKMISQNSHLYSKTTSSAVIRSLSWLPRNVPATCEIPREQDFRMRFGYTQPGASEG